MVLECVHDAGVICIWVAVHDEHYQLHYLILQLIESVVCSKQCVYKGECNGAVVLFVSLY